MSVLGTLYIVENMRHILIPVKCQDQSLFLKAGRVMVSPEGLLTNSGAAEAAVVFTPKEGECVSPWHVRGVKRC